MKHRILDDPALPQMLDDDPLQEGQRHSSVPDCVRVHDDDRATRAHTKARRLSSLHPLWAKQEAFSLQQLREELVQLATSLVRGAKTTGANENVPRIRLHAHLRQWRCIHSRYLR